MPRFIDHHRLTPLHAVRSARSRPRGATRPDGASCQDERATRDPQCSAPRHGFTLVEMLVATALTLIILLIFAQVFREPRARSASSAASARTTPAPGCSIPSSATTCKKPPSATTRTAPPAASSRWGFTTTIPRTSALSRSTRTRPAIWYISENDPDNDTDDVLHFTVSVDELERNKESHPYVGKALADFSAGRFDSGWTSIQPLRQSDRNQPEFDDGNLCKWCHAVPVRRGLLLRS